MLVEWTWAQLIYSLSFHVFRKRNVHENPKNKNFERKKQKKNVSIWTSAFRLYEFSMDWCIRVVFFIVSSYIHILMYAFRACKRIECMTRLNLPALPKIYLFVQKVWRRMIVCVCEHFAEPDPSVNEPCAGWSSWCKQKSHNLICNAYARQSNASISCFECGKWYIVGV